MGLLEIVYDPFMGVLDSMGIRRWRSWVTDLPGARILEIGVGTGLNLPHYGGFKGVTALDPNAEMLARAKRRIGASRQTVSLCLAKGEKLPFSGCSFDSACMTFAMCTVGDPVEVLQELRRVLKPGAALRLLEHVRLGNRLAGSLQDMLTPFWRRVAAGCNLNRDTLELVRANGFAIAMVQKLLGGLLLAMEARVPMGAPTPRRHPSTWWRRPGSYQAP